MIVYATQDIMAHIVRKTLMTVRVLIVPMEGSVLMVTIATLVTAGKDLLDKRVI